MRIYKKIVSLVLAIAMIALAFGGCSSDGETGPITGTAPESQGGDEEFTVPEGMSLTEDGTFGDVMLVVDMQNAYLEDQVWACTDTSVCSDNIVKIIESGSVDNVVLTRYIAPENPVGTWIEYNEKYKEINEDEWLNELIDPLLPYAEKYPCYDKSTYSSYGSPDVVEIAKHADRMIIVGVMSECCVLATVEEAIDAGNKIVYITDACAGSSEEYEAATEMIVEYFSPRCTELMTADEFIASKA